MVGSLPGVWRGAAPVTGASGFGGGGGAGGKGGGGGGGGGGEGLPKHISFHPIFV